MFPDGAAVVYVTNNDDDNNNGAVLVLLGRETRRVGAVARSCQTSRQMTRPIALAARVASAMTSQAKDQHLGRWLGCYHTYIHTYILTATASGTTSELLLLSHQHATKLLVYVDICPPRDMCDCESIQPPRAGYPADSRVWIRTASAHLPTTM